MLCWRRGGNFSVALSCTESLVAGILPFSYSLLISCCCEHNGLEAQKQNGVGGLLYAWVWWLSLPVGMAALPLGFGGSSAAADTCVCLLIPANLQPFVSAYF